MKRRYVGQAGVTLIELIVVVGIIGLTAALGFPRLRNALLAQDVRNARDAVAQMHTRAKAVARARGMQSTLRLAGGDLLVTTLNPVNNNLDTISGPVDVVDDYGVTFVTSRDSLVFDTRGIGTEGSATAIVVSKGEAADTVRISMIGRLVK